MCAVSLRTQNNVHEIIDVCVSKADCDWSCFYAEPADCGLEMIEKDLIMNFFMGFRSRFWQC